MLSSVVSKSLTRPALRQSTGAMSANQLPDFIEFEPKGLRLFHEPHTLNSVVPE